MKFRCERDVLADAFAVAGRAARRSTTPVLEGIRCELTGDHLSVTGSDLDLTIRLALDVQGGVDGVAVIPGKLGALIVKGMESGAVDIETVGGEVVISGGRSRFSLRTLAAEEYPSLPARPGNDITVPGPELRRALAQVLPATSKDEERRPALTGVLVVSHAEGLRLVATDSYRLAVRELPGVRLGGDDTQPVIPQRALAELMKAMGDAEEVHVLLGEQEVAFRAGSTEIQTRLVLHSYPSYEQLLPDQSPIRLTVFRAELLEALGRMKVLADLEDNTPVRLQLDREGLHLSVVSARHGEASETVDAKLEGTEELLMAFNPDFLIEGLHALTAEEVLFDLRDPVKPAVLSGNDDEPYRYLLMPVRVSA